MDCTAYNKELLDRVHIYFRYIAGVLSGIGLIIDILAIKYRFLANYLIYLESIIVVLVFFLPTKSYIEMGNFVVAGISLIVFFGLYCGTNFQLIAIIVSLGVTFFVVRPISYYNPTTGDPLSIASIVLYWLICVILCCTTAMAAINISKLHNMIKTTNMENAKLLDGMHEGILILSKKERRTMFCNHSANKLLNMCLGVDN